MTAFLNKHWFLLGIPLVVALGWLWPEGMRDAGVLHAGAWKDWLVVAVFLCSGLSLPGRALVTACARWRLHVLVQATSLLLVPLLMWLAVMPLRALGMAEDLILGLLFLACLPTTIASCVALTRAGGGDQAGALFNSAGGNLLGIVVTPLTCLLLTGLKPSIPVAAVVAQLGYLVLAPLVVGQVLRLLLPRFIEPYGPVFGKTTLALLLGILANVFANAFARGFPPIGAWSVVLLVATVVGGHLLLLALAWWLSALRLAALDPPGRVAALICSTQKTAALGVPMLAVMFQGDPRLALLTLPILCWHPLQLSVGAALAPRLNAWVSARAAATA
jgi:sodium/bile acid cotransporter 7